ncbi:MAG: hypothetical protein IPJ65_12920 [Archangiaceae bacterium]|nr:hypothetical protein [Archangiaceae bacterium]
MTTRIEGSSTSASSFFSDEPAGPDAPQPIPHGDDTWAHANSAVLYDDLKDSYGSGWFVDHEQLDADFAQLKGPDLGKALRDLQREEKLDPIINQLSPDERQHLAQDALRTGLLERKTPQGKLTATAPLPASFQAMVDDLNALQSKEQHGRLHFNWSGYQEVPTSYQLRQALNDLPAMKVGDSLCVDAKLAAHAGAGGAGVSSKLSVAREADGHFTVSGSFGGHAGVHAGEPLMAAGELGLAARAEYRFETAAQAQDAIELFSTDPQAALERYGRPHALELDAKLGGQLKALLGRSEVLRLRAGAGIDGEVGVRYERAGVLELHVEGKDDGQLAGALGLGHSQVSPRAAGAEVSARVETTFKLKIDDPDAFERDPRGYLIAHAEALARGSELETKVSYGANALHHGTSTEASFTTRGEDLERFAGALAQGRSLAGALEGLSESVELEVREKQYQVVHGGADLRLGLGHHAGVEAGAGYERRTLEENRELFKGPLPQRR